MKNKCKECDGTGVVEFTKERGGPTCNNCGGEGFISAKMAKIVIATILDHPSVHMDGPSHHSLRRAERIIEYLVDQNILPKE